MRRFAKGLVSWGSVIVLVLCLFPDAAPAQARETGSLIGFVFGADGSTPVAGAVIVVKNVSTGAVTEAGASDALGVFKVPGLDPGIYALGVRSSAGSFNSQDFFGVAAGRTAKISIALDRYDGTAAEAAALVIKEQRDKGEAFVGKVVRYDPATKVAGIFVEIGLIQAEDRIHVKGRTTDFYQDLRVLRAHGLKTKRVTTGFEAEVRTPEACQEGDFVYIVCKRGVPPFFLAPLGIAAIVAGALPLSATFEDEPVSPFRIR